MISRATQAPQRVQLAALCLGVFLGALDQTVVATLLPPIIADLEVPFTRLHEAAWVVTGYLLGYTVAMPIVGRLADLRGRVRVYLACLGLFTLASLACGAARTLPWLVVARALQAIGGGALLPITLAVASASADSKKRALALGVVGAVAEAGGVLGPLYGAALVEPLGWRWIFYLNLPLGLAIAALVLRTSDPTPNTQHPTPNLDLRGGLLLGLALGAMTVGLSHEGAFVHPDVYVLGPLALAAVAFGAFVLVERRSPDPLVPPGLALNAANLTNLFVGAALITAMVDVPLWAATILQLTPAQGGLLLLRLTLPIPVGALLGGWGTRLVGPRATAVLGLLCCAASFVLMSGWAPNADDARMTRDLAVGGLGFGLLLAPVAAVAIGRAGEANAGLAAALVTLMRMVGMMVGVSALTSYGLGRFDELVRDLPLPLPVPGEAAGALAARQTEYARRALEAGVAVFHEVFLGAAAVSALALVPALFLRLSGGIERARSLATEEEPHAGA